MLNKCWLNLTTSTFLCYKIRRGIKAKTIIMVWHRKVYLSCCCYCLFIKKLIHHTIRMLFFFFQIYLFKIIFISRSNYTFLWFMRMYNIHVHFQRSEFWFMLQYWCTTNWNIKPGYPWWKIFKIKILMIQIRKKIVKNWDIRSNQFLPFH